MNYLQLVQEAMYRAGVSESVPSTLSGTLGIAEEFTRFVDDAWRELQEESRNWWFRQRLDQTLAISASTDSYAMPTDLETLNYRTVSLYTTAQEDEAALMYIRYEDWRMSKDTVASAEGRPTMITERPDGVLQVWPVPDQAYTLRYDGVWDIDSMSADTDTPGSTITSGTQLLPSRYHWVLVWDAVRRYAEHYQDVAGLEKAQSKYLAQHARLSEKQRPPVVIQPGILTGVGPDFRRSFWR